MFLISTSDWTIACTIEQHKCKIQFACICKYSICKCECVDCGREVGGGDRAACKSKSVCNYVCVCACVCMP